MTVGFFLNRSILARATRHCREEARSARLRVRALGVGTDDGAPGGAAPLPRYEKHEGGDTCL